MAISIESERQDIPYRDPLVVQEDVNKALIEKLSLYPAEAARLRQFLGLANSIDQKHYRSFLNTPFCESLLSHTLRITNIPRSILTRYLLPQLLPIERTLGPELCESTYNGFNPGGLPQHIEISLYVALRTVESLYAKRSFRHWTGSPNQSHDPRVLKLNDTQKRDLDGLWELAWLVTAFRIALAMPIGYIFFRNRIRGLEEQAPSWMPTVEDFQDYRARYGDVRVYPSKSHELSPRMISMSTYYRIFDRAPADVPKLSFAETDAFSDVPNKHNPIYSAFSDALKHVFRGRTFEKLPFFWCYLLNHAFVHDPNFSQISCLLPSEDSTDINHVIESSELQGSSTTETQDIPSQPQSHKPVEPSQPASDLSMRTSTPYEPDPPVSKEDDLSPLVSDICSLVQERLSDNRLWFNEKGATFHSVADVVYVTLPSFFKTVARLLDRPSVDEEFLKSLFLDRGFLDITSVSDEPVLFAIHPKGVRRSLGKCRTWPLTPLGKSSLVPSSLNYSDNPDLKPLS